MYLFILTTILSVCSVHCGPLSKQILRYFNKGTARERELYLQKNDYKHQQSQLSMVDNFAQYSRLQRKINVINQELLELHTQRSSNNFFLGLVFNYGLKIPLILALLCLTVYYRYSPVFVLDDKYDLFPFVNMISYPNKEVNAVSVHFWIMCATSTAKLIKVSNASMRI